MERDVVEIGKFKVVPTGVDETLEIDPLEELLSGELDREIVDNDFFYEEMLEKSQLKAELTYDCLLDGIKRAQYLTRKISYYKKYF